MILCAMLRSICSYECNLILYISCAMGVCTNRVISNQLLSSIFHLIILAILRDNVDTRSIVMLKHTVGDSML
jgi:hypothetical protein